MTHSSAKHLLPPAVQGARKELHGRSGRLSYYVSGEGPPLLLVHSINAAGSVYEVKPIFDAMVGTRRCYAVDLPGFGFSDRSERNYTPKLFVEAIHDMLDLIAKDGWGEEPIDAVAVSLGSEFLARAAAERPDRFKSLTLVTPTGFQRGSEDLHRNPGETREIPGLYRFLTFPLWSRAIYRALVTKPSIRYFLRKTFGGDHYDKGLAAYDYLTTHQPGAKNAPYAFVSGRLFSRDIRFVYARLTLPVWMPHATRGDFSDCSEAGWAKARPNWTVEAMDTGALPYFEKPREFIASLKRFLADADKRDLAA